MAATPTIRTGDYLGIRTDGIVVVRDGETDVPTPVFATRNLNEHVRDVIARGLLVLLSDNPQAQPEGPIFQELRAFAADGRFDSIRYERIDPRPLRAWYSRAREITELGSDQVPSIDPAALVRPDLGPGNGAIRRTGQGLRLRRDDAGFVLEQVAHPSNPERWLARGLDAVRNKTPAERFANGIYEIFGIPDIEPLRPIYDEIVRLATEDAATLGEREFRGEAIAEWIVEARHAIQRGADTPSLVVTDEWDPSFRSQMGAEQR